MNNIYLYDGSFDSLLSLIFNLIHNNIKVFDIKAENDYELNLLDNFIHLKQDDKIINFYKRKISYQIIQAAYLVYLSNDVRKELIIYYFLKNALIYKNEIFHHKNLNCVLHAIRIIKYVKSEAHKLKGFLRFKLIKNNIYYAQMSPTNNVLSILALHFKKRFINEYFLIEDVGRNIFAFYDKNNIIYLNKENINNLDLNIGEKELETEDLWKSFFKTIGIKERKNYKVQRNFMPKKYWNYIIEMEDEK